MEGVRTWSTTELKDMLGTSSKVEFKNFVQDDLRNTLNGVVQVLFPKCDAKWLDTYFPFTNPSFELEVFYAQKYLEVLGCGIIEDKIIENCGVDRVGWAFGLGLERCSILFVSCLF